jgi:hypothetical protein
LGVSLDLENAEAGAHIAPSFLPNGHPAITCRLRCWRMMFFHGSADTDIIFEFMGPKTLAGAIQSARGPRELVPEASPAETVSG